MNQAQSQIPTFAQGIQWVAGGAQGHFPALYDGEQYLCAVWVRNSQTGKQWWEFAVVSVSVDDGVDEPEADLFVEDEIWGWTWDCVDWYVPVKFLAPPMPQEVHNKNQQEPSDATS